MVRSASNGPGEEGEPRRTARVPVSCLGVLFGFLALASLAYAAAGELDPSFGGDGKVVSNVGGFDTAYDVAIQSDGKIVAAGEMPPPGFGLARYNSDGSLDTTFGGDGTVAAPAPAHRAFAVTIQPDGKIVVAGKGHGSNPGAFALARYNPDGSLDTSFDGDGVVVTDFGFNEAALDVAIQRDGKIVAVGGLGTTDDGNLDKWGLVRYNADGSLDPTFNADGRVTTDFARDDHAEAVVIQPDGKIVAAGASDFSAPVSDFALARYNPQGTLDPSFDGDGKVVTDFQGEDSAAGVAIQHDGKIVAAGASNFPGSHFALARYNPQGTLDPSFDGDGKVVTDFGFDDSAADVAIQADGKIVAVGSASGGGNPADFALARYDVVGNLDPAFDGDGKVLTDFGAGALAHAVALQADGRIVAAGVTGFDFALARYLPGAIKPQLTITDVTRFEGNAGLTAFTFTVSLSSPSPQTITVSRQTANGPANAPSDYTALGPATITFSPGQTTKTVTVNVKGEVAIEPSETFSVNLSSPTNATIADGQGKGTIFADDLSPSSQCTITGTAGDDVLNGTSGNDVICGGGGNDQLFGLDGGDVLKGEDGDDLLRGGNGVDLLLGAAGIDDLWGESGNDTLRGGDNGDTLSGGAHSDALFGDVGVDSLDTRDGVSANDSADGGNGSDSCVFDSGDFVTSCP